MHCKNLKLTHAILGIALTFLLLSCAEEEITQTEQAKELIPLKSTNAWSYLLIGYDTQTGYESTLDSVINIVSETNSLMYSESKYIYFDKYNNLYGANLNDGFYCLYKSESGVFSNHLRYAYPSLLNYTFTSIRPELNDTLLVKIEQTSIIVSVEAGTFNCYKYTGTGKRIRLIEYVAPGKGIIRTETYLRRLNAEIYDKLFVTELIGYNLSK